jgi:diguanylate cyclase (GGDEF)-like protein
MHISKVDSASRPKRRVLVLDRNKANPRRSLDSVLRSTLLSQGKDLAQILREVDDISKSLKLNPSDTQILSDALHRTIVSAVKVSILDRDLHSLALTDDLTSLYNRRAFYALATQQLRVMRRKGRGFLLFFADVDHLKEINDTYGHREGDLALIRTAQALQHTFRDSDILARLSGDEFAVLALEASSQDRASILSRLEEQLQKASTAEPRYKLSLSLGTAKFDPRYGATIEDLLSKADRAMYEEKRSHPSHTKVGRMRQ